MLTKKQKEEQIALHELMGRITLTSALQQITGITYTHNSNVFITEHWDVCLLSGNSLPMITEIKVNYWNTYYSGYTAGIKCKKFNELISFQ